MFVRGTRAWQARHPTRLPRTCGDVPLVRAGPRLHGDKA